MSSSVNDCFDNSSNVVPKNISHPINKTVISVEMWDTLKLSPIYND